MVRALYEFFLSNEQEIAFGIGFALVAVGVIMLVALPEQPTIPGKWWLGPLLVIGIGVLVLLLNLFQLWLVGTISGLFFAAAGVVLVGGFLFLFSRNWEGRSRPATRPGLDQQRTGSAQLLDQNSEHEVRTLAAQGQKLEAIKRVRQLTGMGLKDAKDYVESLNHGDLV